MNAEQLDKFRNQWLNELKGGRLSDKNVPQDSNRPGCSDRKESETAESAHDNYNEKKEFHYYYPFKIVGNLLDKKSDFKQANKCSDKNDQASEKPCNNCQKEESSSKCKRLKLSKLEDIFVERKYGEIPKERLLDVLISDIDEITEIPFFDISLPSEVAVKIFQYLGIKDLCSCGQVSRSWRRLAEDELLWCRLCHRLGHEKIYTTREKQNWKQIVRHNVERQRTLVTNWKSRIGKLSHLEHAKGKILCSVQVCEDTVVAGYTSGDVKLWNLSSGDSCVFQPSSTSLVLDINEEGLQQNFVSSVATTGEVTVAAYSQGNVDIWNLASGTKPTQVFTPTTGNQHTPSISLSPGGRTLAVSYGPFIDTLHKGGREEEFSMIQHFDTQNQVKQLKLFNSDCDISTVIFSKDCSVHLYQPTAHSHRGTSGEIVQVSEIHNLIGASVDVIDFKPDQAVLGVATGSYWYGGFTDGYKVSRSSVDVIDFKPDQAVLGVATGSYWYGGFTDGYKVNIYDLASFKPIQTLHGHTLNVSCMNLLDSPPQELVTGSADRKLRVYDMRTSAPEQTLTGHSSYITCVQMDDWKVVSGAENGFLCVWDRRMLNKLWELHNRHPVRYSHFNDKTLVVANISSDKFPQFDDFENTTHRRYRGTLCVYNFLEDLTTKDVPEICLSSYDQPDASRYNIALAVPYDTLSF